MPFTPYNEAIATPLLDEAHRQVQALWQRARREFGIKDVYEVVFAVLNPESMRKLTPPYSHVIPRKEQPTLAILRVDKEMCSERHAEHLIHHILPCEVANVVCKIMPALGDPHVQDEKWHKVYRRLGGVDNGE